MELCLGMRDEPAETLWVRSSMQMEMSNVAVSVCYRQPDQGNNWKKQLEGQCSVSQMVKELIKGNVLLNLIFTDEEELVRHLKV